MDTIERRFVALDSPTAGRNGAGYHPCQGIYQLRAGSKPKTAAIATHYNVDFSEHYLGEYFAERGYGFLGWNTRFRGAETYFMLEHALIDIGVGVRWLREVAGVENVVIIGNSGGGSLMGAYQSQAAKPNLVAQPGMQLPEATNELLEADFYIALNAHTGRPEVLTAWMDPSVTDENDPTSVDSSLDMYDPANGPPYKPEFVESYRKAQAERNHRITAWAWSELERLKERGLSDRLFTMQRTWADLRLLDGALDPSDRPVGVCYAGDPKRANYAAMGIGHANTCRTWLSMWSLEHSQCRGAPHLQQITLPALVVQSTADTGVFPSDAKAIYENLGSEDKHLEFIKGDHYLVGEPSFRPEVTDLLVGWLQERGA